MVVLGINGKEDNRSNYMRKLKMKSQNGNLLQLMD